MIHQNVLRFAGARYLWWALLLITASCLLYATQGGLQPPNGGTWQGYVLGTVGAVLILWLTALGLRKRSYRSTMGSVQGWVSAHVYLGVALLVVATLHSAAQLNWNVHTLTYVLMCIVIVSGMYGAYSYLVHPRRVTENRLGATRQQLFAELFELDQEGMRIAEACDPQTQTATRSAIERTVVGGGVIDQLTGRDRSQLTTPDSGGRSVANKDQQVLIDLIGARMPRAEKAAEAAQLQALLSVVCRRQEILRRIREDVRLAGWMKIWLYLHVPVTVALLGALVVHVITTFIYW